MRHPLLNITSTVTYIIGNTIHLHLTRVVTKMIFLSFFLLKVDRLPWKAFKKLEICFQNKKPSAIVVSI